MASTERVDVGLNRSLPGTRSVYTRDRRTPYQQYERWMQGSRTARCCCETGTGAERARLNAELSYDTMCLRRVTVNQAMLAPKIWLTLTSFVYSSVSQANAVAILVHAIVYDDDVYSLLP